MEISSETLINVLTNKVTELTNQNIIKDSIIEEYKMKLVSYEQVAETNENELKDEE